MAEESFDVAVIGGGPGGYVCAIRASQLGLKTALIESRPTLGGTCLNVGCIPSKALLHSSEMFHFTRNHAAHHGIKADKSALDLPALMKHKDEVVSSLVKGVGGLVRKKGVTVIEGHGRLKSSGTIEISSGSGKKNRTVRAKNIVLATGSAPATLPTLPFDGKLVVHSDHAIGFDKVPKKLTVVGGGAIGLELGSVWARLGSDVTIVEFLPRIAPSFDPDVCRLVERLLKKQGMTIHTSTRVTGLRKTQKKTFLTAEDAKGNKVEYETDKVLIAIGRKPFTENLGLEEAGVETDDKGRIRTGKHLRTNVENIYAIGDAIAGAMLAHKAEEEGVAVAEHLAGKAGHVNYEAIPNVIYIDPELASVGSTEEEAKAKNIAVRTGKFPMSANGRALAIDGADGFVKVVADEKTDRLLGVQIVSKNASELIASAVTHIEYGGSAEDIARTIHAHPTLSEALKEAALAVDKRAIHAL